MESALCSRVDIFSFIIIGNKIVSLFKLKYDLEVLVWLMVDMGLIFLKKLFYFILQMFARTNIADEILTLFCSR